MAEMVGLSRPLTRRAGSVFGILALIKAAWRKRSSPTRIYTEEWPDYLLRDIGLSAAQRDDEGSRHRPMDWLAR